MHPPIRWRMRTSVSRLTGWEERIAQRDAKIDALYVELRNEQSDKLAWIHKCHELELQLKDAEHNRCDRPDSECGRRIPPRRATLIKDKEDKK